MTPALEKVIVFSRRPDSAGSVLDVAGKYVGKKWPESQWCDGWESAALTLSPFFIVISSVKIVKDLADTVVAFFVGRGF